MKYMKLGTGPDIFYTQEATRTVASDIPSDLVIRVNSITFLLQKYMLLPKCGLLQRLCLDDEDDPSTSTVYLHDIPGGEEAFELCAKFCYGITINLSAHNLVPALCAAKFLRMTEAVQKGNLIAKLEAFFGSCILQGWKDSIITLQSTATLPEWSENLGIIRRCIDSIVDKILTPPDKVKWSYTYSRPGYTQKNHDHVSRDWWTEDISNLDIGIFRCIITAIKLTSLFPPQLIGEALHVYASRWLPDAKSRHSFHKSENSPVSPNEDNTEKNRRILETIVSLIPADQGSVTVRFLLRLLNNANLLQRVSPLTKAELIRRSSQQLEEATADDLLLPTCHSSSREDDRHMYDTDLIKDILESFLERWKHQYKADGHTVQPAEVLRTRSIRKVGKLIDSYLEELAKDINMPVAKFASIAEALPNSARPFHDDLYHAISIYLKEHPGINKAEKKQLCRILDCQKLSPETRVDAVKNEQLPLRTVVKVLFFEQEGKDITTNHQMDENIGRSDSPPEHISRSPTPAASTTGGSSKAILVEVEKRKTSKVEGKTRNPLSGSTTDHYYHRAVDLEEKLQTQLEKNVIYRESREADHHQRKGKEIEEVDHHQRKGKEIEKAGHHQIKGKEIEGELAVSKYDSHRTGRKERQLKL